MKNNKLFIGMLSVTLLANTIAPASHKALNINPLKLSVVYADKENDSEKDDVTSKLDYLGDLIKGIENIAGGLTGNQLDWLKAIKNAYDLTSKILKNGLVSASEIRTKLIPRIDLLINVAETITADATELVDSQQQAHVIVGFSVTHALLKALDLFEGPEGLNKASDDLKASLEKARQVPKLTDDSKRTHYTLEKLDRAISNAKSIRNKELKYKLDPNKLAEVDMTIKKAVDVRRNGQATVSEVNSITDELNKLIDEAYKSIPEGERTANKLTKAPLAKDIQVAKNLRDFKLKGNVESSVIKELNRAITKANRVLNDSKTTVNQANAADEDILAAMKTAEDALVAEETPSEVVEEEISEEEVSEETSDEIEADDESEEASIDESLSEEENLVEENIETETIEEIDE
ncbi:CAMP factor family pore-forming toxin [Anaerococcus urinomassiliensis]|uniref:CAMP factor family pore-forming toxin n=1 Tax=Anaerococcus urinomassiliensis TaxID=1745712 RepID=UPI00093AF2C7|nr:CAMP factor family pore-forming toxin [Anaerococcus urinomassiliensis]